MTVPVGTPGPPIPPAAVADSRTPLRWPVSLVAGGTAAAVAGVGLRLAGEVAGAVTLVALAHLAVGLVVFLRHGGPRVTATGVYFLTAGLLYGGAATVVVHTTRYAPELWTVTLLSYLAHLALLLIRARPPRRALSVVAGAVGSRVQVGPVRWCIPVGLAYLAAAVAVQPITTGVLHNAIAFVGVLLLALPAVYGLHLRRPSRALPDVALLVAGAVLFVAVFFTGGGRLNPVNLAACVALVANRPWPARWHKTVAVAAVIPVVLVGGFIRLQSVAEFGIEQGFEDVVQSGAGLGSVINPVDLFAEIVAADRAGGEAALPRQYGKSFAVAAVSLVPRSLWPGKPVSFGTELAQTLRPLGPEGHSLAALLGAEFYVNFGWLGLAALPLVMAWVLRRLDWALARAANRPAPDARLVAGLIVIVLSAAMMDLVWGGSFTFASRGLLRAALLAPLAVAAWAVARRRARGTVELAPRA